MKKRDYWIDNVRSVLIFLVVTGHFGLVVQHRSEFWTWYRQFISIFHIPAFMIITGMMARNRIDSKRYKDMIKRIFVPYVICNFIMFMTFQALGVESVSGIEQTGFFVILQPYYFLWFLLAIFIFSLLTTQLNRLGRKKHILFAIIVAVLAGYGEPIKYMQMSKIAPFYIFFVAGYYTDIQQLKVFIKNKICIICSIGVICMMLFITLNDIYVIETGILSMELQYAKFENIIITPMVTRVIILGLGFVLSLAVFALTPFKKNITTIVGQYSIYPYCIHTLIMPFVFYRLDRQWLYNLNTPGEIIGIFIGCLGIIFIMVSKPVRKIFKNILEPETRSIENIINNR